MAFVRDVYDVKLGPLPRNPVRLLADVSRWGFWVPFREALPAGRPKLIQTLVSGLLPAFRAASPGFGAMLKEELALILPGLSEEEIARILARSYRFHLQAQLEELLLGKLDKEICLRHIRPEGTENIEIARGKGKGGIVLFPHMGGFMLLIALTSLLGHPYTQYAARGFPPEEFLERNPGFRPNWFTHQTRMAREQSEDRLPAHFISMETNVRTLYRVLENNELVGISFDGRVGNRFLPVKYFGRTALLNPGAFRLTISTGAALIPAGCSVDDDGRNVAHYFPPLWPDPSLKGPAQVMELMERYLKTAVEPFVRLHPHCYANWLVHGRSRAHVDDHPLFVDYAPDDRWKKYLKDS